MASSAIMDLLKENAMASNDPKEIVMGFILHDDGPGLHLYLKTLSPQERQNLLRLSVTQYGDNQALSQAINNCSFSCMRALILMGSDMALGYGPRKLLDQNQLFYHYVQNSDLAYNILRSYHGKIEDISFASRSPPETCISILCQSHCSSLRLLPLLALLGFQPIKTPHHDDMKLLKGDENDDDPTASSRARKRRGVYDWLNTYYSTNHHRSLKNTCRVAIRKALRVPDEGTVGELVLPERLKDYLLLAFPV